MADHLIKLAGLFENQSKSSGDTYFTGLLNSGAKRQSSTSRARGLRMDRGGVDGIGSMLTEAIIGVATLGGLRVMERRG